MLVARQKGETKRVRDRVIQPQTCLEKTFVILGMDTGIPIGRAGVVRRDRFCQHRFDLCWISIVSRRSHWCGQIECRVAWIAYSNIRRDLEAEALELAGLVVGVVLPPV